MTRNKKTGMVVALAATLLATAAWAQLSDAPGPAPGDQPGMIRRLPFAAGTVRTVDTAAGTVTLTPLFAFTQGNVQTVKITTATQITAQTSAKVSDLIVGETIQVRGVPTGITASQITDSDGGSDRLPSNPLEERVNTLGTQPNGGRGPWLGGAPAIAQATGKITGLTPLTISISPDVSVTLKAAPDVTVTRTLTEKIGDLKVGDRILADGQPGDEGTLIADRIRVNGYGLRGLSH